MKSLNMFAVLFAFTLCACSQGPNGTQGPAGEPGATGPAATPSPAPAESSVQTMVDTENQYRLSVGQEELVTGLDCTLYTVPTSTTAIIGATGLVNAGSWRYIGAFNEANTPVTTGLNILPSFMQQTYQTWFIVKCTGQLVVSDNDWHEFDLTSDDGSNLYISGLLINNDGLHGAATVTKSKYLKYGFYSFELDFFQGAGNQALILNEDGALMSGANFYH